MLKHKRAYPMNITPKKRWIVIPQKLLAQALSLEPSDPEPQDAFALQLHSLRRGWNECFTAGGNGQEDIKHVDKGWSRKEVGMLLTKVGG